MFDGNEYRHSMGDSGYFRVRGNMIYFDTWGTYHIRIKRFYMILNGTPHLRRD